jgi:hypothetical protein
MPNNIDEFEEEPSKLDESLFSEEKVYNHHRGNSKNHRLSRSMDSWSHGNTGIDEFLKRSSNSFLNPDSSFKHTDNFVDELVNPEISCDNPLDMNSNTDSLIIPKNPASSIYQNESSKDGYSRNEERKLSRDDSSICNFKSMDVTHNTS